MATELTKTGPARNLTTPFSAPWLRSLRTALGDENGKPILMMGFQFGERQRRHILAEIRRLETLLSPSRDNREQIAIELARCFAAFPTQGQSDVPAELRTESYFEALGDLPAWSISEARARIFRGEAALDQRFMPTAPDLRKVALTIVRPLRNDLDDLVRLRDATQFATPSTEERKRVADGLESLAVELGAKRRASPESEAVRARAALRERAKELGIDPAEVDRLPNAPVSARKLRAPV